MFSLSADDIALLNPNTRTCPIFRTRRDAELTKSIYRRVPVLVRTGDPDGNPWDISFKQGLFNMTSASHLFRTREQLAELGAELDGNVFVRDEKRWLPLYEAKMLHHFDHRWATYDGGDTRELADAEKCDPEREVLPRYWVAEAEVRAQLGDWTGEWLLGWRDVCRNTDVRTVIATPLPCVAVGHTSPLLFAAASAASRASLLAVLDSFTSITSLARR